MPDMYSLFNTLGELEEEIEKEDRIHSTSMVYKEINNEMMISGLRLEYENGSGNQIFYANSDLKFDISVKYKADELSENSVRLSRVLPDNLDDIEELYDYYERKEECRKVWGTATKNALVGAASARFPAAAIIAYVGMAAEDPSYTSALAAFKQVGVVTGPKYDLGNAPWDAGCILEGMGTVAAAYEARDNAYKEILDDWYVGGTEVTVSYPGDSSQNDIFLVSKGQYDADILIKKEMLSNEGFSALYTNEVAGEYDHISIGLDKIERCYDMYSEEGATDPENINNENNYNSILMDIKTEERCVTPKEKIEVLKILWRGPQDDEEKQKLENLTDAEYQTYVDGLKKY